MWPNTSTKQRKAWGVYCKENEILLSIHTFTRSINRHVACAKRPQHCDGTKKHYYIYEMNVIYYLQHAPVWIDTFHIRQKHIMRHVSPTQKGQDTVWSIMDDRTRLSSTVCCRISWSRHQMETSSALLAICAGNSSVTGEFPAQRPGTRSFDVFFDLRLVK